MSSTIQTLSGSPTATSSATASCITFTPKKNGYVPEYACNAQWSYSPSFGAAVFFSAAFGISLVLHLFQAFYFKKLKLTWVLLMGVAWEFVAFTARAYGALNQQSFAAAYIAQIFLLLAPMWVNAFIYMVLGRMIYFFVPAQKIWGIKGIKVAKIFVWLDVASFLTQLGGGLLIQPGQDAKTLMTGIHIYMGGIGFQEGCILLFTAIAAKFFLTMKNQERSNITGNQILDGRPSNWRPLLYTLFISLVLITIRIIFRMIEFAAGEDPEKNRIPYTEGYLFGLDALPMLLCVVLLNVVHPGRTLQGENSEFPKGPSRREKKELKRVKKAEKQAKKQAKRDGKQYIPMGNLAGQDMV
jgi:hypothetical protein